MLLGIPTRPFMSGTPALESVSFPEGEGLVLAPVAGPEPALLSTCGRLPPPENGLAASHAQDFTLVLRALRWTTPGPGLEEAVRACGQGGGRGAGASAAGEPRYARRFERLGVPIEPASPRPAGGREPAPGARGAAGEAADRRGPLRALGPGRRRAR